MELGESWIIQLTIISGKYINPKNTRTQYEPENDIKISVLHFMILHRQMSMIQFSSSSSITLTKQSILLKWCQKCPLLIIDKLFLWVLILLPIPTRINYTTSFWYLRFETFNVLSLDEYFTIPKESLWWEEKGLLLGTYSNSCPKTHFL